MIQGYDTDFHKAYVINGNSALLKCEIPSHVADFVTVESWVDNEGTEYFSDLNNNYGKCCEKYHIAMIFLIYIVNSTTSSSHKYNVLMVSVENVK